MSTLSNATVIHCSLALGALVIQAGCGSSASSTSEAPSGSEVAVSVVSGALNNGEGSTVAMAELRAPRSSPVERALHAVSPIGTAWAADWSCKGGSLSPAFAGPSKGPYSFTPRSCTVMWGEGRSASSSWSGPFTLSYGAACDGTHALVDLQVAGCSITRTTGAQGATRTVTGPDGNSYAIDHDTDGEGTGFDSAVSPAPSNGGLDLTCGAGGCAAEKTLILNGSHLTGTVTIGRDAKKIWDHTVSTSASGLTVKGSGPSRVVTGSVTVQHNLLRVTSTTAFDAVSYGDPGCCFPTAGSVSTTFSKGADVGKTETLAFSASCGEATLTRADGTAEPLTLAHCL